jgi:hypothetical protein
MNRIVLIYNLLIIILLIIAGIVSSDSGNQIAFSLLFVPVALYFARRLFQATPKPALLSSMGLTPYDGASNHHNYSLEANPDYELLEPEILSDEQVRDLNRRLFLKLIGSAGLAAFAFSLFTKRTHAAFFGSMPGPGIVQIKDSAGNVVDPAQKEPTDGYEINDVDDDGLPAYYGFLDRDGRWYITREDDSGGYRYTRGTFDYAANWTDRNSLSYDYFNNVF